MTMSLLQNFVTNGLLEPMALIFVGTLMISLGNVQRRKASLAKIAEETGKT